MIIESPATVRDILDFAAFGRREDFKEIEIVTGASFLDNPMQFLSDLRAIRHSSSGALLGIGGYEGIKGCDVLVWMVLTTVVYQHKLEFLRWSKRRRDELLKDHPTILNATLKENKFHIDYLKWLGAEFQEAEGDPRFVVFFISRRKDKPCVTSAQ